MQNLKNKGNKKTCAPKMATSEGERKLVPDWDGNGLKLCFRSVDDT